MAITAGTTPLMPIDLGLTEWLYGDKTNPHQVKAESEKTSSRFGAGYTGPTGENITPESVNAYQSTITGKNIPMSSDVNKSALGYRAPMSTGIPTNTQTQQTSGGGRGGGFNTKDPGANPGSGWFWDAADGWKQINDMAGQSVSEEELNSLYSPAMDYLNKAESVLRGQLPSTLALLEQQAGTSRNLLGGQRTSALGQLGEQATQATQRKEDAISAARRLFNELQMANQQRFGGASSAGLAASELQGRELMQNRAGIGREFGTAMRQIEMSKADVENQYNTGLQQIEDRKQQAINEVNADFQNKLLDIDARRADTQQAKAAARLQALQEARDRVFQINLQEFNFRRQLDAQKQAADTQLSQYSNALQSQVGLGQQATNTMLGNVRPDATTNFAVGGGTQTMGSQILRGQVRPDEEQYVGQIAPTTRRATDLLSAGQFNTRNLLGL